MNVLYVGGDFNDEKPRPSGYFAKLWEALELFRHEGGGITMTNGGTMEDLRNILQGIEKFNVIYWFANVPNTEAKLVNSIKQLAPKAILVTSKNNLDGRYPYQSIISRMLTIKANLSVVFTKDGNTIQGTVIDPLGNCYGEEYCPGIAEVAVTLCARVAQLTGFTRGKCVSKQADATPPQNVDHPFFDLARGYAEKFHELIHAHDTARFLGNLSFRCERGFPSYRSGNGIVYVSARNLDKREVGPEGMVAVELGEYISHVVNYHGERKPSVDTPIQVALYQMFPHINFMIHSHVYVKGAPFTQHKVPCGALEEVDEIADLLEKNKPFPFAAVNLLGHGSIVMADSSDLLHNIKFEARPLLEK